MDCRFHGIGLKAANFTSRDTVKKEGPWQGVEGGGWRVEGGWRRVEGGGWRVEGRGSRVEGGGWRVEGGPLSFAHLAQHQRKLNSSPQSAPHVVAGEDC